MKRIFIVGSPRSGTTYLQSLLLKGDAITTFPETHFFRYIYQPTILNRVFNLADKDKANYIFKELESIIPGFQGGMKRPFLPTLNYYIKRYQNSLDQIARGRNKVAWVEKTPIHFHYMNIIEGYIDNPLFIHIVRNGNDVIKSHFLVSNENPKRWGNRSLDFCINRWKRDVNFSKDSLGRGNHIFVFYENLVNNLDFELNKIFTFLNLEYDRSKDDIPDDHILSFEKWKLGSNHMKRTTPQVQNKLEREQAAYISKRIENVDISIFK